MKKSIIMIFCLCLCVGNVWGSGIVFDPTNWTENAAVALQTLQMMKTMKTRLTMGRLNLTDLSDLKNLLPKNKDVINSYTGDSAYAKLSQLDPNSGGYDQNRDSTLKKYYTLPQDPNNVRSDLGSLMSGDVLNQWTADAEQNKNNWQRVTDAIAISAKEKLMEKSRQDQLGQMQNELDSLGEKSQLKTEQLIAAELLFMAQQNESQGSQLRNVEEAQTNQLAQQTSARSEDFKQEEQRVKAAANQGSEIPNIKTWGKM